MKLSPKITVICPVYNTEKYLPRCIDSVLCQTFVDFELILVNDGSTDASGEICQQYAQKDSRIKYITVEENRGVANARNVGLENSLGDYIAWIDSDDWADADWLETMYNLITTNSGDIVSTKRRFIYDLIEKKGKETYDSEIMILDTEQVLQALVDNVFTSTLMNKLFESSLFSGLSFPVGKNYEDAILIHTILSRAKRIVISNKITYNYFVRFGSITQTYSIKNEYDRFLAHKERFTFFCSTKRTELSKKEAEIVFFDALKIQEMGLFRRNSLEEIKIIEAVFNWAQSFLESDKSILSGDIIKKFNAVHGTIVSKLEIFVRYELKNRLHFWTLMHLPRYCITLIRRVKGVFKDE